MRAAMRQLFGVIVLCLLAMGTVVQAQDQARVVYEDKNGALFSVTLSGENEVQLNTKDLPLDTLNPALNRSNISVGSNGIVVYLAADGNLYSVPASGGTPTQLTTSGLYQDYDYFTPYIVSGDGQYVVFLSRSDGQLYSVSTDGGDPVLLVPDGWTFATNPFDVHSFYFITADNQTVIATLQSARNVMHLFALPIGGGEGVQLSSRMASGGNVLSVYVRGDKVVYLADQEVDEKYGLFYVPLSGGDSQKISDDAIPLHDWSRIEIAPDGEKVIFSASDGIYAIPVAGGAAQRLGGDPYQLTGWQLSPDSSFAYLMAENTRANFAVNLATGESTNYEFGNVCCTFSPDSSRVLIAGRNQNGGWSVYESPLGGGHFNEISAPNTSIVTDTSGYYLSHLEIQISPDSQYAVYQATDSNGIGNFYSSALGAGAPAVQLNAYPGSQGFHRAYSITADSQSVVFLDNEEAVDFGDLYVVPIAGGEPIRVTTDDSAGVIDFKLSA